MYKVVEIKKDQWVCGEDHNDYVGYHLIVLVDSQGNEHIAIPEYFTSWENCVKVIGRINGKPDKVTPAGHYSFGRPF